VGENKMKTKEDKKPEYKKLIQYRIQQVIKDGKKVAGVYTYAPEVRK
jgi:hypothetical protein